ncbi:MAG: Ldh family oxidoreductase [Candidatus Latescibacterota bacterium]|nr:Ldh family oxidoreductase [Candidatus Latescibacterota bacterium]
MRISAGRAEKFCLDVLAQLDVPEATATISACTMVTASLRGIDSHGIALCATYAARIRSGQIRPQRPALVRFESCGAAHLDGQHGMGPALACVASDLAAIKAHRNGIAAVTLADGNYVGALAFYAERIAAQGLLALCVTNSTPRVAPLGGRSGLHGTNPFCWSVPCDSALPMVFDAATGNAAAKVVQAADEGRPLSPGIAIDEKGSPTSDPAKAVRGTLLPVGDHLGYGMGLLVDLLTGGLAQSPMAREVPPVNFIDGPYGCSFFAMAIAPDAFGASMHDFQRRAAELAAAARDTPPLRGWERVRIPGDRAREEEDQRRSRGIPLHPGRWSAVLDRLRSCGLDMEDWRDP